MGISQLVEEPVEAWDASGEALSGTDTFDEVRGLATGLEGVSVEHLPVREDALREGTTRGGSSQGLSEAEGLCDWQIGLDVHKSGASDWVLCLDGATALGYALVHCTDAIVRALDIDLEDRLLESGGCGEL